MKGADLFGIGWRGLLAHRVRTGLTAAAVAVGTASVLFLTALGAGARDWVESQFTSLGSNVLIALPGRTQTRGGPPLAPATTRDITLEDMLSIPRRMPGVVRMIPLVIGEATVKSGERGRTATVIGSSQEFLRTRNVRIGLGQGLPETDPREKLDVCVIGRTVERELFGATNPLGARVRLGQFSFRVIGTIVEAGKRAGVDLDEVVLVPAASAMALFNRRGLFRLVVEISSFGDLSIAKQRLNGILKDRHGGAEDFTILDPGSLASALGGIIDIITAALAGIAAVSLGVAGIGVMNIMVVSVTERTGEIGILKAVGAANAQVAAIFLSEAAILTFLGGLIGIAGGYALTELAYQLYPTIPFYVPRWALVSALAMSVGVGLVFGLSPALRAARLPPLEALRRKP